MVPARILQRWWSYFHFNTLSVSRNVCQKILKIKVGYIVVIFRISTTSFQFFPRNAKRLAIYPHPPQSQCSINIPRGLNQMGCYRHFEGFIRYFVGRKSPTRSRQEEFKIMSLKKKDTAFTMSDSALLQF